MSNRGPDEETPARKNPSAGDPHPVEHFLEVLLIAQDRAAKQSDETLRQVWRTTVRDIETILADDTMEVAEARDRLAQRTDPEGCLMYACACRLLEAHDAAKLEAEKVIDRARRNRN